MSWFFSGSGVDLLNGLVEWWPLDEASGSRAGAHAGLTLTDNNTVTGAAGVGGSSASQFTGANVEFLSRATEAALNQAGSFTFCAAVYFDAVGSDKVVLAKANVQTLEASFMLALDGVSNYASFYAWTGASFAGQVNVQASTVGALLHQTWHWFFGWYDAGAGQIGVTVNALTPNTAAFVGPVYGSTADFRIGNWQHSGGERPMDGRIQRVGLWNRVLTAFERAEIYNAGAGVDYPF